MVLTRPADSMPAHTRRTPGRRLAGEHPRVTTAKLTLTTPPGPDAAQVKSSWLLTNWSEFDGHQAW